VKHAKVSGPVDLISAEAYQHKRVKPSSRHVYVSMEQIAGREFPPDH